MLYSYLFVLIISMFLNELYVVKFKNYLKSKYGILKIKKQDFIDIKIREYRRKLIKIYTIKE